MTRQTVFDAAGPDAERLADLTWLLIGGSVAIFMIVLVALVLALGGGRRVRLALAAPRVVMIGGVAFPVLVLGALSVHTFGLMRVLGTPTRAEEAPLSIQVVAHQFWWEVRYPETGIVTANEIRIPAGRDVELALDSADVIHSLWVPALNGKLDMIPGRTNRLRLHAAQPGVMRGQCAEFCGLQHARMAFLVVAMTPEDFAAWQDRQRLPAETPDDPERARGRAVFAESGCGGCHAIRGTPWQGREGPDLSGLGSRLTIGAGLFPMNRGTIAGWVADAQGLKPGSRMPSFAPAIAGPDLRALGMWLESLR
jgi:cytochrome c oxidase subunit 2